LKKITAVAGPAFPTLIKDVRKNLNALLTATADRGHDPLTRSDDTSKTLYTTVGKPTCPYDSYKVVDRDGKELPATPRGSS